MKRKGESGGGGEGSRKGERVREKGQEREGEGWRM